LAIGFDEVWKERRGPYRATTARRSRSPTTRRPCRPATSSSSPASSRPTPKTAGCRRRSATIPTTRTTPRTIERQAEYALRNLQALLEDAGSDLEHVVNVQVFLKDLRDFDGFDPVWRRFFPTPPPRTTLQMADPVIEDALVAVNLIAVLRDLDIEVIERDAAPHPRANYSQAVAAGDLVFLAGQLASDFKTGVSPEAFVAPAFPFYGSDIQLQIEYVVGNLSAMLEAAGNSLDRVVKTQTSSPTSTTSTATTRSGSATSSHRRGRRSELAGDGLLVARTLVEIDVIATRG
jgi:enamine deaminase RidA (YjgF/YER057c/UK114 family)